MKKSILILIVFLIGITTFGQTLGSFPVSSGFGGGVEGANRQRVIDASGTYVRNIAPHEIDYLQSHGLWNSRFAIVSPSGYAATVIYSQVPTDGTADLVVARASVKTTVNEDLLLEEIAATVPSIDFTDGTPVILAEPQRTNELEDAKSVYSDYWTCSGATIASDPETKGADQNVSSTANGDYTTFGSASATGFSATSNGGATHEAGTADEIVVTATNIIRVSFTLVLNSGTAPTVALKDALAGANIGNAKTQVATAGSNDMYFYGSSATTGVVEFSNTSTATDFVISVLSVSEVTGYSAPHATLTTSAFKLVESDQNEVHRVFSGTVLVTPTEEQVSSVFAKQGERNWFSIHVTDAVAGIDVWFDLDNGVVGTEDAGITGTITPMADGWYRCSVDWTETVASNRSFIYLADADNSSTYAGDGSSGIFIAFTQYEQDASYLTSWIYDGTEGSTTTRQADEINNAGVAGTFNSEAGYLYMESAALFDDLTDRYISISDGSVANAVQLYYSSTTNQIVGKIIVGSATQATLTYTLSDETVFSKALVSWATDDFTLVVNGVERATDVSGSVPAAGTFDEFSLDDGNAGNDFYGKIKAVIHGDAISAAKRVSITTQ